MVLALFADCAAFWVHRSKNFAAFSLKLQGLFAQYNIPGDKCLPQLARYSLAFINLKLL